MIGTAGWNLPSQVQDQFPKVGTHLARYARVLDSVEINSAFYRNHQPETYERWAASVPASFRFSVKLSRHFTQKTRLEDTGSLLASTLEDIASLGPKWGCLLVQLPPSLEFELKRTERFFKALRKHYGGPMALEPRHPSWASAESQGLATEFQLAKVLADPEPCPWAGFDSPFLYLRLHGWPVIYQSRYSRESLIRARNQMNEAAAEGKPAWCIFDNTTYGYAAENALELRDIYAPAWAHQTAS